MSDEFDWENFKAIEDEDSRSLYKTIQAVEAAQQLLVNELQSKIQEARQHIEMYGDLFARDEKGEVVRTKLGQSVSIHNPISNSKELERLEALLRLKEDMFSTLRTRYENGEAGKEATLSDEDLTAILGQS